jgi:hypothetical protein
VSLDGWDEDDEEVGLLEVYCVDTSMSMDKSQGFLSFIGQTKLELARSIIAHPLAIEKNIKPQNHYSSLVTFNLTAIQNVPFAIHNKDQMKAIEKALKTVVVIKGTAIFDALRFCEKLISKFIQEYSKNVTKWLIILHLFSDGEDNSSSVSDPYHQQIEINSLSAKSVHQRILYSFGDTFEKVKPLGESLQAAVIMVKPGTLANSFTDRDKLIFGCVNKSPQPAPKRKSKRFSYVNRDSPDLVEFLYQLQKADEVFQGKVIETEGLFRQNAVFNVVNETTERFTEGKDTIQDYNDPITIGHFFKNSLKKFDIIPKTTQKLLLETFRDAETEEDKLFAVQFVLKQFPKTNLQCLEIVIRIINRVANAQQAALKQNKALSLSSLAQLFSLILLPGDESKDLQTHIVISKDVIEFMLDHRIQLFSLKDSH